MTMPLSNTRSRTSMRLPPAGARSTATVVSLWLEFLLLQRGQALVDLVQLAAQVLQVTRRGCLQPRGRRGGKTWIRPPPVESDLRRFVHRTYQQPDLDGQQLDVR